MINKGAIVMNITEEIKLKKAHIALMRHQQTALYSGVILLGDSAVEDGVPTAYTDGVNKKYGREFVAKLSDAELRGLVLHENLHVALKHMIRFKKEFREDGMVINMAADYAVNDIIMQIHESDSAFIKLPEGGLWDIKYRGWDVRSIYDDIRKQNPKRKDPQRGKDGGGGSGDEEVMVNGRKVKGESIDEHDFSSDKNLSPEETKSLEGKIEQALRQGGILAGRMGGKVPRIIDELLQPKVDWRDVLREFVSSAVAGKDEYTWRKFNRHMMANDLYIPSLENETIGELVVAIDTSGSIGGVELTEFATELASICNVCYPEKVRVLWWDTDVHGEQVFSNDYSNIAKLLKPQGGGGTRVSCVNNYIKKESIKAEAVIVFTDGYVEREIQWDVSCPTLWMVTQNKHFTPPTGKVVKYERTT